MEKCENISASPNLSWSVGGKNKCRSNGTIGATGSMVWYIDTIPAGMAPSNNAKKKNIIPPFFYEFCQQTRTLIKQQSMREVHVSIVVHTGIVNHYYFIKINVE